MAKIRLALLASALAATAACGGREAAPAVDDALRNDLALAAQVRAQAPQPFVGPHELGQYPPLPVGAQGYAPQYAPQPQYYPQPVYAPAPAPRPAAATVRRTSAPARSPGPVASQPAEPRRVIVEKNTKRDAAIGAVAGAAIGVAASSKKDRVKGGLIGAVAGGTIGAIIGNNVDVKRRTQW